MRIASNAAGSLVAVALAVIASAAAAQSTPDLTSLQDEVASLRAAQQALRQEVQELRGLLQRAPAPPPAATGPAPGIELTLDGAQVRGASDARVTLVEFSDFQCPFCARHAAATYPQIVRDYVDPGKVRYAFMGFPIEALHPAAFEQHAAAACAAEQQRFWPMHDRLFADPRGHDAKALAGHAAALGLDTRAFRACLASGRHAADIRRVIKTGEAIGVVGTPTFLIGVMDGDGRFKAIKVLSGAKPYAAFRDAIDSVVAAVLAQNDAGPARLAIRP